MHVHIWHINCLLNYSFGTNYTSLVSGLNLLFLLFFLLFSVSLLANLPDDKLSKIVDCLEVVSYSVKLSPFLFEGQFDFYMTCTSLWQLLGARSTADSGCQNIITIWPYTITECQQIHSSSSLQELPDLSCWWTGPILFLSSPGAVCCYPNYLTKAPESVYSNGGRVIS